MSEHQHDMGQLQVNQGQALLAGMSQILQDRNNHLAQQIQASQQNAMTMIVAAAADAATLPPNPTTPSQQPPQQQDLDRDGGSEEM